MKFSIKNIRAGILFLAVLLLVIVVLDKYNSARKSEQRFSECFNQVSENPNPEDIVGVSLANLSVSEEKEIHEIIKKAFEGQYLYRYCYENEKEMDELIKDLYIPEKYQQFKKKFKKEYEIWCGMDLKNISSSLEKIKFSKPRKYKDFDNRIGIIGEPKSGSAHYFLFKKIDNCWKIEKEIWHIKPCFLNETSIIKQLLEQKNNETPEARITEYLEAIQQNDKTKALEIWQLTEEDENWKVDPNYSLLEKRRDDITEELIKNKITDFEIIDIKWRSIGTYIKKSEGILEDYRSDIASGARVQVQLTDINNNKSNYTFDIFVEGIYPEKIERDYSSLRHWILRDIYPENEEPLFWTREDK